MGFLFKLVGFMLLVEFEFDNFVIFFFIELINLLFMLFEFGDLVVVIVVIVL